ncbi:hypothetical protein ACIRPK_23035 [Kitasatospora sp. NPDC101801]|uniref:hypothetical protein n=1 Tax=Kitasatospora sp. NPDC101801 TaxID=3364103 RepID=UPI0038161226
MRRPRARLLVVTLSGALALAAPAPAGAEDTEPAVVVNGTFSSPRVPGDKTWLDAVDGWTGGGVGSATRAAHRDGLQAAHLSRPDSTTPLSTRLRGVRAGATVTLSWDDSPDSCVKQGVARRAYAVTVAGSANPTGNFATNDPIGKANWFYGRIYSFTAAEDAPQITFTFSPTPDSPGCQPLLGNVAAKQTAPPPQQNDPCAGGSAASPQCKDTAADKEKIEKCPPTSKECLASVAGDGKAEKDGIAKETQAVEDFGKVPREQDPNTAAAALCALPNALTADVKPGEAPIQPSDWWFC